MTRFFYDTEFLEDHKQVDLISIGMVCYETGDTFYAVSTEFDTQAVANHWWLMENVMSSIGHEQTSGYQIGTGMPVRDLRVTDPAARSREEIRDGLLEFVGRNYRLIGQEIEFWAWYGSYDWVALCQLFGAMINLPDVWPKISMDIKQLQRQHGVNDMPKQTEGKHNALDDARFNIERYSHILRQAAA